LTHLGCLNPVVNHVHKAQTRAIVGPEATDLIASAVERIKRLTAADVKISQLVIMTVELFKRWESVDIQASYIVVITPNIRKTVVNVA
jgi:hypothetical protein